MVKKFLAGAALVLAVGGVAVGTAAAQAPASADTQVAVSACIGVYCGGR